MKFLILNTGGTIFKKSSQLTGKMENLLSIYEILKKANKEELDYEIANVASKSGAELTFETLFNIRDIVTKNLSKFNGFLLLTGTDAMDEAAFALDLILDLQGLPFLITGSMKVIL